MGDVSNGEPPLANSADYSPIANVVDSVLPIFLAELPRGLIGSDAQFPQLKGVNRPDNLTGWVLTESSLLRFGDSVSRP